MSKHTPGPWRIGHQTDYGVFNPSVIQTGEDVGIATVYGIPLHVKLDEVENDPKCAEGLANARLIAAAPDLLAACKEALQSSEDSEGGGYRVLNEMLRAAIAKAEGGSHD